MSASRDAHDELRELLAALREDAMDDAQAERFVELLRDDPDARRTYIRHMAMVANLRSSLAGSPSTRSGQWPVVGGPCEAASGFPTSSIPPIIIDLSPTLHSPVGGFVFSHFVAAVILGIGLLIGWTWRISYVGDDSIRRMPELADSDRRQESSPAIAAPTVARITDLADCQWKQWRLENGEWREKSESNIPKTQDPRPKTPLSVSLGDRFALTSGLMEITYDTGAKVILQGPCTYEVESARGGYLAVGRLTAKVEKGEGGREKGEEKANQKSHDPLSTTHYPLFSVRTPTAVVVDLGTEFGVEVEKSGATRSHVFQGKVELRSENSREPTAPGGFIQLGVGESARVERGANKIVAVTREPGQPERFARRMPCATGSASAGVRSPGFSRQLATKPPEGGTTNRITYRLTDLGTLGGKMSRAFAINAAGQVVGQSSDATGAMHAFLYADGKMKDLGALHGGNSWAYGINSVGQVVGGFGPNLTDCRAFLYGDGAMKDLGTLGGPNACAYTINDAGQAVGASVNSRGIQHAYLYAGGAGMKDLGALGGPNANSFALGINAAGLVVGGSEIEGGLTHAFLYTSASGMKDLGALDGRRSQASRVNDGGRIVGDLLVGKGDKLAFLYSADAGMKILGTFGGTNSFALGINNAGQVVGAADWTVGAPVRAFLYSDGKLTNLNSLVDPAAGWRLIQAYGINDSGQIAGYGRAPDGNTRAFLLTPIVVQASRLHKETAVAPPASQPQPWADRRTSP